uniref:Uncharacterized protein n=1 Tax=Rhizophora mucronata TaxID=61149 RepID=A0A2P2J3U0_RHIMU
MRLRTNAGVPKPFPLFNLTIRNRFVRMNTPPPLDR